MTHPLIPTACHRLVVMHDNGVDPPHESEQCGVFLSPAGVRAYVNRRFGAGLFVAEPHGQPDSLCWRVRVRETGEDAHFTLLTWSETLYATEELSE